MTLLPSLNYLIPCMKTFNNVRLAQFTAVSHYNLWNALYSKATKNQVGYLDRQSICSCYYFSKTYSKKEKNIYNTTTNYNNCNFAFINSLAPARDCNHNRSWVQYRGSCRLFYQCHVFKPSVEKMEEVINRSQVWYHCTLWAMSPARHYNCKQGILGTTHRVL